MSAEPFDASLPCGPCSTCGLKTVNQGTRRCDRCWEIESSLLAYLRSGTKARDLVQRLMLVALTEATAREQSR